MLNEAFTIIADGLAISLSVFSDFFPNVKTKILPTTGKILYVT